MRTFAQKPKGTQQTTSAKSTKPSRSFVGQSRDVQYILHLQRTIGNQSVLKLLQTTTDNVDTSSATSISTRFSHDFSQIPVHASVQRSIQPKLKVGCQGDKYEQEADQVADRVVQLKLPEGGNSGETGSHSTLQNIEAQIQPGSSLGKPLDTSTNNEMIRKIGFDFSGVRIHTEEPAVYLNKRLNARAFTYGSDIFFNKGEYNPNSFSGKKLLAHELTHVVQQSVIGGGAQRKIIQCTTIGQILDEFFSPFSSETLWVMPDSDNYTRIVRTWQPVIDAVNQAKADLEANCTDWSSNHMTDPSWTPGRTDPPVTDPNAHRIWVASPPGTDPTTCRNAFIVYVSSGRNIQTFELYTCSIGSFGIYATVNSIDCTAGTAEMNIWMYNAMDQGSFGRYASHPLFSLSGMERQYMWWNWTESHSWSPTPPGPTPAPTPTPTPARPTTYTVVRGDTMYAIARHYGVSLRDLIAANPHVRDPNLIYPGDILNIP